MNEWEGRLTCVGFLTTAGVLFPEMDDEMSFEDFFSLIGVDDHEYFGDDMTAAQGWLRFEYRGVEVMVNTNEIDTDGGWDITGAEVVKRNAPAAIADTETVDANREIAEPTMFG